jgi:hypothetical protein
MQNILSCSTEIDFVKQRLRTNHEILLYQTYRNFYWHYAVAIGNWAISWGPVTPGAIEGDRGQIRANLMDTRYTEAINVDYLTREEIAENLLASFEAFDNKWNYSFVGWNCEHWARLVTTGIPVCYQVDFTPWFVNADSFTTLLDALG